MTYLGAALAALAFAGAALAVIAAIEALFGDDDHD